jgi:hypothetical protein
MKRLAGVRSIALSFPLCAVWVVGAAYAQTADGRVVKLPTRSSSKVLSRAHRKLRCCTATPQKPACTSCELNLLLV